MKIMVCPFCNLPESRIILSNQQAVAVADGFPISPGHTLIIPRRHIESIFETNSEEANALILLLAEAKNFVDKEFKPDGFNIGVNDGPAAGQTIPHLHIHLIPRFTGDRPDPRGGVRWIIPEKADYWSIQAWNGFK
jgi:diadenosine tetraphosphate (Ap4A) HIT family hydrolase